MNSVQEAAHEIVDRVWRKWASFYHDELGGIDPLLHKTSPAEIDLIFRAFFAKYSQVEDIQGVFFFAMRSCEYIHTPTPVRTKIARLRCLIFRDRNRKIIPHNHSILLRRSKLMTVVFEDQKNGETMD